MSVVVYSKPSCTQCNATYRRLTRAGVPFEKVDLTENESLLEEFKAKGYASAPVTVFGEHTVAGYDPDGLDDLIAGYFGSMHESEL